MNELNQLRGKKVKIHYNLHKHCFSVKYSTEPMRYASSLMLTDVSFTVNENGRQQVIHEKCKNVHAHVIGILLGADFENMVETEGFDRVTYNPYKRGTFYRVDSEESVATASMALLRNKEVWIA